MAVSRTLFVFKGHWADSVSIWKVLQTGLKSFLKTLFSLQNWINWIKWINDHLIAFVLILITYCIYRIYGHLVFSIDAWLNYSHKINYRHQNSNFHFKIQNCLFMIVNFYPNLCQYKDLNLAFCGCGIHKYGYILSI